MKTRIVTLLNDQSDLFLKEISERLAESEDTIRPHLQLLVRDGVVKIKEDTVEHLYMYRLSDNWANNIELNR